MALVRIVTLVTVMETRLPEKLANNVNDDFAKSFKVGQLPGPVLGLSRDEYILALQTNQ